MGSCLLALSWSILILLNRRVHRLASLHLDPLRLFAVAVALVVLFAEETIYDRKFAGKQPPRPENYFLDRFESLVGIRGWKATNRRSA